MITSSFNYSTIAQTPFPQQEQQLNLGLYNNSTYGISFMYPVDWYKAEILTGPLVNIKFLAPSNTSSSLFSLPTIDILIDKSLGNISSLKDYRAIQEQRFTAVFGNATVLVNQSTTLSNLPAFEIVFITNQSGMPSTIGQVFTIKEDRAFVITFAAEQWEYLRYLPVYARLVESFTIAN